MKIAERLQALSTSPTIAVMQEAQNLRRQGIDIIDFGPGEPDFPTPEPIKRAGIQAIEENFTKYTAAVGMLELRKAVAEKLNQRWGSRFTEANVAITSGAKHAIYNLCMGYLDEGDEVLIPAPYWVTFPEIVKLAQGRPKVITTAEEDGFELRPETVSESLSANTRALIINFPNNPTGANISADSLKALSEQARKRNFLLLSDETYEYFVYEGRQHHSVAALVDPEDEHYAIVGSFSKTYSMTGWRVGFCVAHPDLIRKVAAFQSHQTGNPTSISQKAALAALDLPLDTIETMRQEYTRRRTLVLERLAGIPGFRCARPYGAFYAFPNVSEAIEATGTGDSQGFARFLIQQARVTTVPGSAFGLEGYLRLSYATSVETLKTGLSRIQEAVEQAAVSG